MLLVLSLRNLSFLLYPLNFFFFCNWQILASNQSGLFNVQKETRTNVSLFKNGIYCQLHMQFHLHKTQTNSLRAELIVNC